MEQEEEEEVDEFELQLQLEEKERLAKQEGAALPKGLTYTDDDGTVMEWEAERKAYFPKIDADFIAQYQMNYGAPSTEDPSQAEWAKLPEEEKTKRYDEYWANYYQAYSKEQPKLPTFDDEGNEIEDTGDDKGNKKEGKDKQSKKSKEKSDEEEEEEEEEEKEEGKEEEKKEEFNPLSDEHYQYNLYYYGQEYADEYKQYYIDHPEEAAMPDWISERNKAAEEAKDPKKEEKKKGKKAEKPEKRKEPPREEGWFDVDHAKSTQVYISGLPDDTTEEEFNELMTKCGLVMFDPHTKKPKLKMYKDKEGNFKGDGLCSYIKPESVALALDVLDESDVKGHTIKVERASFELKGAFDPKMKKKKLSNKAKNKLKERQQALFDWRPDKDPFAAVERPKHERVVVLKNMFDAEEFEKDPTLINELRIDVREECAKFGEVKKVTLYDRNKEGVISVMFSQHDEADKCIAALSGRWFGGKQVQAGCHDGKSKYEVQETEEEKAKRIADWNAYLAGEEKKEGEAGTTEGSKEKGVEGVNDSKEEVSGNKGSEPSSSVSEKGGGSGVVMEDVGEEEGVV